MKSLEMEYEHICTACGEKLKKSEIAFSELDLKPYHKEMTKCNRRHPNSYENHAKRNGHLVEMLTITDAQQLWRKRRLDAMEGVDAEAVLKMLKGPTTLRMDTVENAAYIIELSNENGGISFSQVIRMIITDHREKSGRTSIDFSEIGVGVADEPEDTDKDEEIVQQFVEDEPEQSEDDDNDLNTF